MGFDVQDGSSNNDQKTKPCDNQQKKRTCEIIDIALPADHRIKLKECEKKDDYIDLARELKKTVEHAGENYTNSLLVRLEQKLK